MECGKTNQTTNGSKIIILFLLVMVVFSMMLLGCQKEKKEDGVSALKNSQAYDDALFSLEAEQPVMILLLDGLGYDQYENAISSGNGKFLATLPKAEKATTYMPSISPVGLAAMVTGVGPNENGIKKRGDFDLQKEDVFQKAKSLGKTAVLIEGDMKLINTSLDPRLNIDMDGDGTTDHEVFTDAIKQLKEKPALIFIHFHGIDDVSHQFSPGSAKALEKISEIDEYLSELFSLWEGDIIISADHGQHEENGEGIHGKELPLDMEVPYLYIKK